MTIEGLSPGLPFICSEFVEVMLFVVVGSLERNEVMGTSVQDDHSWAGEEPKEDSVVSAKGL